VLLDAWQPLRAPARPSPQVVIVAIDEKSLAKFGPSSIARNAYAPLLERLVDAQARMIGLDVTFAAIEGQADNNRVLAEAMRKAGNVVFGYEFTNLGDPTPPGMPPPDAVRANSLSRFEATALPMAPSLIPPEPELATAAAGLGHVTAFSSDDGRIRTLPLLVVHGDRAYPSLALQMARVYTGTRLAEVSFEGSSIRLGDWNIPVSASGEVLLNWPAAGASAFPIYSFLEVERGDVPAEAFRSKAVLVAATAKGMDDRDFPFAVEAPGVLIHATFLDNVFRADFVRAPLWTWLLEWGLFAALCLLGVWLLPRLTTPQLLVGVPVLVLLLLAGAAFSYVQKGVWLKVVHPCLALLLPMALVMTRRLTESEKQTRDVAAEKIESQKLLGLSFQEKGMLDMALATFNQLPFTPDMKLVYVNLGVDYENRGQRDKALLAYHKVFEVDPKFEGVGLRMQRLSQAGGIAPTFTPSQAPTAVASAPASAAPTERSPLADLVTTPVPGSESPTFAIPTGPTLSGSDPTSLPTFAAPTMATPNPVTPAPRTGGAPAPTLGAGVVPGARFGRFEIERHLGRGGMGDVYLVRDTVINRKAALKTIRPDANLSTQELIEMRQRFYREAQTAGKLTHPNIVTVYDVGEELGLSYIVMEFVEGETLTQLMRKGRLSVAQIKHVIYNAGMGLDFAHASGVFHRDVKPDNIMVTRTGMVKVMDFGIARIVESSLTKTGSLIGTPAYMSPEQVNGQKIDARSDIFSLGVILYELLAGRKPFTGETVHSLMFNILSADPAQVSELDAKVDRAWDEILRKALAKTREERYASAREFAEAVTQAPVR
jgi:serine/threonine-protein kinase